MGFDNRGIVFLRPGMRRATRNAYRPARLRPFTRKRAALRTAPRTALRSATRTLTRFDKPRKALQSSLIQSPGGIVTQSYYSAYNAPKMSAYIRKNATAPNYEVTNGAGNFEALSGFQGSAWYATQFSVSFQRILNAMPAAAPAGNLTRRFLLEKSEQKITYTNASSASAILTLYDIAVKQDNDLANPLTAWQNGVAMETTLPAGTPPFNVLGIEPWMSQQFKQFFKIVRKRVVNLAAGASHQHNVVLSPNVVMSEQRILENRFLKGISYITLATVKGVPVCDDADIPRLVSTAPIQIDTVAQYNTKYRWISDVDTDLYIVNNMTTLLQPENMNVFQGQAQPVTKAQ